MTKPTSSYVERMMAPVPQKNVLALVQHLADTPTEDHSFERAIVAVMQLFPERRHDRMRTALIMRMTAVARLIQAGALKPYILGETPQGATLLDEDVLRITARHPMVIQGNDLVFEAEPFAAVVLARKKARGRA